MKPSLLAAACSLALGPCLTPRHAPAADSYEQPPLHYSATHPNDAAQNLQRLMRLGRAPIDRTDAWTVLRDVMSYLEIPAESQVLVFSKTSQQNNRISPQTPRVIYFGDNAYIGYCLGGAIEVCTIDPVLGPIFYLLDPDTPPDQNLRFERDQGCLSCHGGPFSPDVPGILVRSVYPNADGHPILSQGSTLVGTSTPFDHRWGGWYVTGLHGSARHRGNTLAVEQDGQIHLQTESGANVTDLSPLFNVAAYPRPSSDIVALMVLEHQSFTQNALTKANHSAIRAMHMQTALQQELGETVHAEPIGTARRIIDHSAEDVVDALLFYEEAELPAGGIDGDIAFQDAFKINAPVSSTGRSLKDFQLLNRLFKHRCSYMIHSITFQHLTPPLKATVMTLLASALDAEAPTDRYSYLSDSERQHIRQILAETLPDTPAAWRRTAAAN